MPNYRELSHTVWHIVNFPQITGFALPSPSPSYSRSLSHYGILLIFSVWPIYVRHTKCACDRLVQMRFQMQTTNCKYAEQSALQNECANETEKALILNDRKRKPYTFKCNFLPLNQGSNFSTLNYVYTLKFVWHNEINCKKLHESGESHRKMPQSFIEINQRRWLLRLESCKIFSINNDYN